MPCRNCGVIARRRQLQRNAQESAMQCNATRNQRCASIPTLINSQCESQSQSHVISWLLSQVSTHRVNGLDHETVTTRFSLPGHKVEFGSKNKSLEAGKVIFKSQRTYFHGELKVTLPTSRYLFFKPNSTLWPGSENRVVTVS